LGIQKGQSRLYLSDSGVSSKDIFGGLNPGC
jgi:hypothetical protein